MVFAVTGHTEAIFTEKALSSGMNIVLFKPVDGQQLKQLVHEIGFQEENTTTQALDHGTGVLDFSPQNLLGDDQDPDKEERGV